MKRCAVCVKPYRSGTIALVKEGADTWKRKRVCGTCAKGGVLVVAGAAAASRCACRKPATTCAGCANEQERRDRAAQLADLVRKLRAYAKTYAAAVDERPANERDEYTDGVADGLERAADMVKSGDW